MRNTTEINDLAAQRLREAQILYENEMYDGAYYLAGYSVELKLKGKICDRLGIPNLYDDMDSITNSIKGISDIRRSLKTHNLFTLLLFSGLKNKFDNEKAVNSEFAKASSLLFNAWDENVRYKPCGHIRDQDVKTLINLLSHSNGLLRWIELN